MELEEVERYTPAMVELGIEPPDTDDLWDVRRALLQLRQRLSVDLDQGGMPAYEHQTDPGLLHRHTANMAALRDVADTATEEDLEVLRIGRGEFTDDFEEELAFFFERFTDKHEISQWKNRRFLFEQISRLLERPRMYGPAHADSVGRRLAMLNPLPESDVPALVDYLKGEGEEDPRALKAAIEQQRAAARATELVPGRIAALFPREGTTQRPDSWAPDERIPSALQSYDLVTRIGKPGPPPEDVIAQIQKGESPLSSKAAIDYFTGTMGLSIDEAKRILGEMKRSAEGRRGKSGARIAMQPSSVICKLYRSRKLPYQPPRELFSETGKHATIILMSPPSESPRVMTWRRGTHIDCDMTGLQATDLLKSLSRSLQSAILWLAEKPGRMKHSTLYIGTVGTPGLYRIWKPGDVLSLASVSANLQAGRKSGPSLDVSTGTIDDYNSALKKTFGTRVVKPSREPTERKPRKERKERKPRAPRTAATPDLQARVDELSSKKFTVERLKELATGMGVDIKGVRKKSAFATRIAQAEMAEERPSPVVEAAPVQLQTRKKKSKPKKSAAEQLAVIAAGGEVESPYESYVPESPELESGPIANLFETIVSTVSKSMGEDEE